MRKLAAVDVATVSILYCNKAVSNFYQPYTQLSAYSSENIKWKEKQQEKKKRRNNIENNGVSTHFPFR